MKEMCHIIPRGACPTCGHKQFVVVESEINAYLTGLDGEVVSDKELGYSAKGKCCRCGKVYDMIPTSTGFIPATKLRKLLFEYSVHLPLDDMINYDGLPNPMEANPDGR
jgi:DNA-directed RNA polymerase subunit RPC12/RpoP